MTPGTRPWRRIARAAPLPARGRAVAVISLTVAMSNPHVRLQCKRPLTRPFRPTGLQGCYLAEMARLIAARTGKNKKAKGRSKSRRASRSGLADRRFERGDARGECLVLFARQPGHFLDRLELLALDHVEVAQHALGLIAQQRVELAPHALGNAGGVVHQPRHLVVEPVARLGHGFAPNLSITMGAAPAVCKSRSSLDRRACWRHDARSVSKCLISFSRFPSSIRCSCTSGRSRSVGTRSAISPASSSVGSTPRRSCARRAPG